MVTTKFVPEGKYNKLQELIAQSNNFLQTQLNPVSYKSSRPFVTESIKHPTAENVQAAFYASANCAKIVLQYVQLKDKIFCAILQLVDSITSSTPFDQSSFLSS